VSLAARVARLERAQRLSAPPPPPAQPTDEEIAEILATIEEHRRGAAHILVSTAAAYAGRADYGAQDAILSDQPPATPPREPEVPVDEPETAAQVRERACRLHEGRIRRLI
jgi:hypothetical protein